jgi:hypothetical protein
MVSVLEYGRSWVGSLIGSNQRLIYIMIMVGSYPLQDSNTMVWSYPPYKTTSYPLQDSNTRVWCYPSYKTTTKLLASKRHEEKKVCM